MLEKNRERKKFMKKICILLIIILAFACCATACQSTDSDDRIQIVVSIYPVYDWVCEIVGDSADNVNITLLLDNGNDMHSYEPSVSETVQILEADMFIYVGGESDEWVGDILDNNDTSTLTVINLVEVLGDDTLDEEVVEGMEDAHDHDDCCDEDHDHDHDDEEDAETDEHVWLSLNNAMTIGTAIEAELSAIDADNATTYSANLSAYTAELEALDALYESAVASAVKEYVLFGDRFPFIYLFNDYSISYYAAFTGCSTATEASAETIAFLVDKVVELELDVILIIDGSDASIASTILSNAITADSSRQDTQILTLDSMQSVVLSGLDAEYSYLSVMASNLEVLELALA